MLINMLRSAVKMLQDNKDPKVQCARDLLDEVILSLEKPELDKASSQYIPGDENLSPEALQAKSELRGY